MQLIVRDGGRTPAHTMCEQFWHGTGSGTDTATVDRFDALASVEITK